MAAIDLIRASLGIHKAVGSLPVAPDSCYIKTDMNSDSGRILWLGKALFVWDTKKLKYTPFFVIFLTDLMDVLPVCAQQLVQPGTALAVRHAACALGSGFKPEATASRSQSEKLP